MVWKMLFEEFQDGCLVHGHFGYVHRVILAIILSLHFGGCILSSFCLRQYMDWKMLFEKYQNVVKF